jgi:chromosome segregation ATPase
MSEDYVSHNQHRADLAELRLEISGQLASLDKRTELIAQELGALRRETTEWRGEMQGEMREFRTVIRQEMREFRTEMQGEMSGLRRDMRQEISDLRGEMSNQSTSLRSEFGSFRTTTQRQLWVMIGVVATAVIGALVKLLFFP